MAAVDHDELVDALDFVSSGAAMGHAALISLDTGRIFWMSGAEWLDGEDVPDDIDTSDRYLAVPQPEA